MDLSNVVHLNLLVYGRELMFMNRSADFIYSVWIKC